MTQEQSFEIHAKIKDEFTNLAMKLSKKHKLCVDVVAEIGIAELMVMNSVIATTRELEDDA